MIPMWVRESITMTEHHGQGNLQMEHLIEVTFS